MSRHNLLVSNVAHVDTPGYVPRDLQRSSPSAFGVALQQSQQGHIGIGGSEASEHGTVFLDRSGGAGLDGNFVSLDLEAAKLAANQSRYDVVSTMLAAEYSQLAFAAKDGSAA